GEIITAPVLASDSAYVTNLDGTIFAFRQEDGQEVWREPKNATSSPMVWNRQCYFSQRREVPLAAAGKQRMQQWEHVAAKGTEAGSSTRTFSQTAGLADYLDHAKRQRSSPRYAGAFAADASVGFAAFKADAKIHQAMQNLGQAHVSSIWAYQGSKPFISGSR